MNKRAMSLIRRYARHLGMTDQNSINTMKRNWKSANWKERTAERKRVESILRGDTKDVG